jgi:hypothetical protein
MNYVENLNSTQWRKLFTIFKSRSMQRLNIFWARECFLFKFTSLSGVWNFKKLFLLGRAHQSMAHAGFQPHVPLTTPTHSPPTQSPRGDRAQGRERAGVGRRRCPCRVGLIQRWGRVLFPFPSFFRAASTSRPHSASLVPATRLTVEHHPRPTLSPSSVEGVAAPSSSSHRPRCRVGLHLRLLLPPWAGYHWPPWFDLRWANRPHRKLPRWSPVLSDPRFYPDSHWSEPSSTTVNRCQLPCRRQDVPVSLYPPNHLPSFPSVQASSPATPCPTSSPVVLGIGWWAISGERGGGGRSPCFQIGPTSFGPEEQCLFLFF